MTTRAHDLLQTALTLPAPDRAGVAAALLSSLDDEADDAAEVEAAWASELQARASRVLSGESAGEAWE